MKDFIAQRVVARFSAKAAKAKYPEVVAALSKELGERYAFYFKVKATRNKIVLQLKKKDTFYWDTGAKAKSPADRVEITHLDGEKAQFQVYLRGGDSGWSWDPYRRPPQFHESHNDLHLNRFPNPDTDPVEFKQAVEGLVKTILAGVGKAGWVSIPIPGHSGKFTSRTIDDWEAEEKDKKEQEKEREQKAQKEQEQREKAVLSLPSRKSEGRYPSFDLAYLEAEDHLKKGKDTAGLRLLIEIGEVVDTFGPRLSMNEVYRVQDKVYKLWSLLLSHLDDKKDSTGIQLVKRRVLGVFDRMVGAAVDARQDRDDDEGDDDEGDDQF